MAESFSWRFTGSTGLVGMAENSSGRASETLLRGDLPGQPDQLSVAVAAVIRRTVLNQAIIAYY